MASALESTSLAKDIEKALPVVLPGSSSSLGRTELDSPPACFRFRDLPEELQSLIVRFCIPDWSIHLFRSAHHVCKAESGTRKQEVRYTARRSPAFQASLYQTDKHMRELSRGEASRNFVGLLSTGYLAVTSKSWKLNTDCACLPPEQRILMKQNSLSSVLHSVTTVHCWVSGFTNFDLDLLQVLPNLRVVVACSSRILFDDYIYGFASEDILIRHISDDALNKLAASGFDTLQMDIVKRLWEVNVAPIVEMKVEVGSGNMKFSFICIFRLYKAEAGRVASTVIYRCSSDKWKSMDDRGKISAFVGKSQRVQ